MKSSVFFDSKGMYKFRSILAVLFLVLFLSACTKCGSPESSETQSTANDEELFEDSTDDSMMNDMDHEMPVEEEQTATEQSSSSASNSGSKCEVTISGNDQMKFDTDTLTISKSCSKVTVTLVHSGKLPKAAMGHNILIVEKSDLTTIVKEAASAASSDYVPKSNKVLFASKLIGGGEKTAFDIDPSKFKSGVEYIFFCSFPGHFGLMQGKVSLIN